MFKNHLALSSSSEPIKSDKEIVVRNVLTDRNTREITIDTMASEIRKVLNDNEQLKKELKLLNDKLSNAEFMSGNGIDPIRLNAQLSGLAKQIREQTDRINKLENRKFPSFIQQTYDEKSEINRNDEYLEIENSRGNNTEGEHITYEKSHTEENSNEQTNEKNIFSSQDSKEFNKLNQPLTEQIPHFNFIKIYKNKNDVLFSELSEQTNNEKKLDGFYLPSGSILTGVLINGLDAPTGQQARKEPFPAVVRLQKNAILPNLRQEDIKECFLLISGYGDLSSERAYLRGETISCINSKNQIIEGTLDGYAVGDDGKVGIRGRLVSKQGQIIAKSLMAGFLSGLSNAFDVTAVPTISTSSNGTVNYEKVFSSSALQGAATKGLSNSLERIANFYIQMAEGLYPVVEIDAGRRIDIIVSRGSHISILKEHSTQNLNIK